MQINGFSNFTFVGKLGFSNKKEEVFKLGTSKNDKKYGMLKLSVKAGNNMAFVEALGMDDAKYNVFYKAEGADKYVKTEFAKNEVTKEMLENIRRDSKYVVKLNPSLVDDKVVYGVQKTFLDVLSFIQFINENLDDLKDKTVCIYGKPEVNVYKGKRNFKFRFTGLTEVLPDNANEELKLEIPLVFRKDSVDVIPDIEGFKKLSPAERKFHISAYAVKYNSGLKRNELIDMDFKLDLSSVDVEDLRTPMYLKVLKMMFNECEGRPLNAKKYYSGVAICTYTNGREMVVEFDDLTKNLIACGMVTESKVLQEKGLYGQRTTEIKVARLKIDNFLSEVDIDEETDFYIEEKDNVIEVTADNEIESGEFGIQI